MGIYLRKSISVGPFRFNLSKSGVGLSAGVKGFRVGTGPRGNYVHMGRGGVYYRKTLPNLANNEKPPARESSNSGDPIPVGPTHGPMQTIDSGDVTKMVDSDSAELLKEISTKHQKMRLWPAVLAAGIVLTFAVKLMSGLIFTLLFTLAASYYDKLRKTVVLFYDLEDEAESNYEHLMDVLGSMTSCKKVWHIAAQGHVYDKKYHAGADSVVERKLTEIKKASPNFLKTNIDVITVKVGTQDMFFFPDRVLVYESGKVGAISYKELNIQVSASNFIETEGVPKDSEIVDYTWRYVNKRGGPDKRFANNPEIPVVKYEYVHFKSASGLNEQICLSKVGASYGLADAISMI